MKRVDLLQKIIENGAVFVRSRGGHDIYRNVITGATQPIPRHREINEYTARSILKHLSAPSND